DNVWIELAGDVSAGRLEVLPDVAGGKITLRVTLNGTRNCVVKPFFVVRDSSGKEVLRAEAGRQRLRSGEPLHLCLDADAGALQTWSAGPDGKPVLYSVQILLGDEVLKTVRFGYRDVKIRGKDVLVNGEKTHFAAENIAFYRTLITWADCVMNPDWVRNFLRTAIHTYGFNFLRMHLGHAPSFWYDIADEEGIMIQDEWCFMHEKDPQGENLAQTEREFAAWVGQNINHPSIIGWDMENEGDVDLFDLSSRLREYDPTRMWSEDDFDTQHRYEYSENIVPVPYCEPSAEKPTTVLESCRLWVNQRGQLEPRENFKTSRTASSWGVYYYTTDIIEQLQADIHADQGTYFRSIEVQAWAPFALLSGTVNGHNFFRGDIGKALEPQKNLEVLKSFNGRLGASFLMLQAREWYRDRVSYAPGSIFSKPVVVWNDNGEEKPLDVCVTLEDEEGKCAGRESFKVTVPPYKALTLDGSFSLRLPSAEGIYLLRITVSDGDSSFEGPSRRLSVGQRPQDLSLPFEGAVCVLDHFLPGIPESLKPKIIERTFLNPIDQISKGGQVVKYTVYEKDSAKTFKMALDPDGNVLSRELLKDKSSGWLKHAF
ncbi:MAG: glycoside hydrolase, partial [Candidatus Cryptobacteroides sp.]